MAAPALGCGVLLPTLHPAGRGAPPQVVQAARLAEQLGFQSVWVGDDPARPAPVLDAPSCLAAAAAVTERVALGFSVLLLGLRNPAWTAKQLASIDLLAGGGRLRLGVGTGDHLEPEAASERAARLDDALDVISELVCGRAVDHTGATLRVRSPALQPALESPPPIYVSGRGEGALRRAARFGDAWLAIGLTADGIAERAQLLAALAREHGRPTPRVAALAAVRPDSIDGAVEQLHQFVEAGVTEIIVHPPGREPLDQYERLAEVRSRLEAAAAHGCGT